MGHVLVIGGSRGIGRTVVDRLMDRGHEVTVFARDRRDLPAKGLTRSLAAELAPTIRVNTVAPSLTDTPLADRLLGSEQRRDASAQRHPLRRIGTTEDVAHAVTYLLCDARWTTGSVLPVDGGLGELSANN